MSVYCLFRQDENKAANSGNPIQHIFLTFIYNRSCVILRDKSNTFHRVSAPVLPLLLFFKVIAIACSSPLTPYPLPLTPRLLLLAHFHLAHFHHHRAVVGMHDIGQDGRRAQPSPQRLAHPVVIDAPTGIAPARPTPEAPPAVSLRAGIEHTERIDHARCLVAVHPFALLGQETRHAHLALRVVDVDGLVAYVIVAAHDEVGTLAPHLLHKRQESFQEIHLERLPLVTRRAGRHVHAHHRHVAEVRPQHAPLGIVAGMVHARHHAVGLPPGEDAHAAVTLLLRRVEVGRVTQCSKGCGIDLFRLRLRLLHAQHVRQLLRQPVRQSLGHGRADAVHIIGNDFHLKENFMVREDAKTRRNFSFIKRHANKYLCVFASLRTVIASLHFLSV